MPDTTCLHRVSWLMHRPECEGPLLTGTCAFDLVAVSCPLFEKLWQRSNSISTDGSRIEGKGSSPKEVTIGVWLSGGVPAKLAWPMFLEVTDLASIQWWFLLRRGCLGEVKCMRLLFLNTPLFGSLARLQEHPFPLAK